MRRLFAFAFLGWLSLAPVLAQPITPVQMVNANLATTNVQSFITTSNVFTAPRTLTIIDRSSLNAYYIQFVDTINAISPANPLTINVNGGGLLNGSPTLVISQPGVYAFFTPSADGYKVNIVYPSSGSGNPAAGTSGQIQYNNAGVFGGFTTSGDATINTGTGALTLATVNANVGTFGSATSCITTTQNAKGLTTAISAATCTPALGSITGLGTGVPAALAIAVGSAGGPVTFNGAGGTPSSMVGTNITGVPIATGISGLSAGCATALTTPTSVNLRTCFTDETGTGLVYFQGGDIGTPSAGVGSNLTALNATQLTTGTIPAARTNGHQNGTATNDNAAAGEIGEYQESVLASGSATSLTTATSKTIVSLSLTAGDWEVACAVSFLPAATTSITQTAASLSLTTNSLDLTVGRANTISTAAQIPGVSTTALPTMPLRFSFASTTSVFCIGFAAFTVSTMTAYGTIKARRAR